ncbi:MAG: siderophore-interacting protein [Nocardioides sp.]
MTDLSPRLRRIGLGGDELAGLKWRAGQEIEFRIGSRDFRHYTPAMYDPVNGRMEVIFSFGTSGPGTLWARQLRTADRLSLLGPGGGVRVDRARPLTLLGDATTIGLFTALVAAGTAEIEGTGAVEVPPADVSTVRELLPSVDVIACETQPGRALERWIEERLPLPTGARVVLAGHAQSIQRLRSRLRVAGHSSRDVTMKAHWSTGRRGL